MPIIVPQRKSCSKISSVAQDDKDEAGISKMKSFDKNLESPAGKKIRKAKSLSAQFLVNIDELINNVPGSYDQTGSVLSRASSNGLGYSFPLAGATMPSENFSDVLRLQIPNCKPILTNPSSVWVENIFQAPNKPDQDPIRVRPDPRQCIPASNRIRSETGRFRPIQSRNRPIPAETEPISADTVRFRRLSDR
ncbi:hypothetical protein I3760_15G018600 [Carya illinoinensis]|nr:hypothetical protein I3760_15G018600 [Carya illinoinensis]